MKTASFFSSQQSAVSHEPRATSHEPRATSHQHFNSFPRCEEVGSAFYAVEGFLYDGGQALHLDFRDGADAEADALGQGTGKDRSASSA